MTRDDLSEIAAAASCEWGSGPTSLRSMARSLLRPGREARRQDISHEGGCRCVDRQPTRRCSGGALRRSHSWPSEFRALREEMARRTA